MAKKLTKRKAFTFLRSYFDVLNEIPSKDDKLSFLISIINKQFMDENPKDLTFIANLSYESQRHAIEKSVKGYKDKMKTDLLGNPLVSTTNHPKQGSCVPPYEHPSQQEKEKEKEKLTTIYEKFVEEIKKGAFDTRIESLYMRLRLRPNTLTPLLKEYKLHIIEENRVHKDTNDYFINFKNWLNVQDRIRKLDKYKI